MFLLKIVRTAFLRTSCARSALCLDILICLELLADVPWHRQHHISASIASQLARMHHISSLWGSLRKTSGFSAGIDTIPCWDRYLGVLCGDRYRSLWGSLRGSIPFLLGFSAGIDRGSLRGSIPFYSLRGSIHTFCRPRSPDG